jgi:hypothetical protein
MRTPALLSLFLLAACGPSDSDPGPGGVTVGEAKALDDAAEMLDHRRLPPGTIASPSPSPTASATGEPQ